jgi:NADH:ubiquinone oxidoreductase subunit F (NADH-binding)
VTAGAQAGTSRWPARHSVGVRLLAGPPGALERLGDHERRIGARPMGGAWLLDALEQSGLRGRGGAWFPTHRKWRQAARAESGDAVVVVNGSEGEPLSAKDRLLLERRPHLVFDGAILAAETLGATEVVLYLSRSSSDTDRAVDAALAERVGLDEPRVRVERTAHRYVAGESSAVVSRLSGGTSRPRFTLVRSATQGVDGRPTLVQNAETLAHAAMIARFGPTWFRRVGTDAAPGTALVTLSGNVHRPGVYEVDLRATIGDVLRDAGGSPSVPAGALIGGYFGSWVDARSLSACRWTRTRCGREGRPASAAVSSPCCRQTAARSSRPRASCPTLLRRARASAGRA